MRTLGDSTSNDEYEVKYANIIELGQLKYDSRITKNFRKGATAKVFKGKWNEKEIAYYKLLIMKKEK